jgi:hypothetical protein
MIFWVLETISAGGTYCVGGSRVTNWGNVGAWEKLETISGFSRPLLRLTLCNELFNTLQRRHHGGFRSGLD